MAGRSERSEPQDLSELEQRLEAEAEGYNACLTHAQQLQQQLAATEQERLQRLGRVRLLEELVGRENGDGE